MTLLTSHVFEVHVAHSWGKSALTVLTVFVLQINAQHSFAALSNGNIAHKYILNNTSAASTCFDTNYTIKFRTVHLAVLNEQVAVTRITSYNVCYTKLLRVGSQLHA